MLQILLRPRSKSPVKGLVPRRRDRSVFLWAALPVLSFLLLSSAIGARAAAPPTSFPVSSCADCTQSQVRVAGTPSGRFLVVWDGSSPQDPRGVLRRLFEPAGAPRGAEALVNSAILPAQAGSSVAANAGGYVTVWSEARAGGGSTVLVQRFRPLGARLGGAIAVDTDAAGTQVENVNPVAVRTADGGFVAVWIRHVPAVAGTAPEVVARGFSAAGAPLGPPARLSVVLASGERPDLCADSAGRLYAAWATADAIRPFQASLYGVAARRVGLSGAAIGNEVAVAPPRASRAATAISCGAAGFVVAWSSDRAPAVDAEDVLVQRFTQRGRPLGTPLLANVATAGIQDRPAISHDSAGRFVVVWEDATAHGLQARRFSPEGIPQGNPFVVRTNPSRLSEPAEPDVAFTGTAGSFVVVWREHKEVFGRVFGSGATAAVRLASAGDDALAPRDAVEDTAGDEEEPGADLAQIVGSRDW